MRLPTMAPWDKSLINKWPFSVDIDYGMDIDHKTVNPMIGAITLLVLQVATWMICGYIPNGWTLSPIQVQK